MFGCFGRCDRASVSVVLEDQVHGEQVRLIQRDVHSLALCRGQFRHRAVVLSYCDTLDHYVHTYFEDIEQLYEKMYQLYV